MKRVTKGTAEFVKHLVREAKRSRIRALLADDPVKETREIRKARSAEKLCKRISETNGYETAAYNADGEFM